MIPLNHGSPDPEYSGIQWVHPDAAPWISMVICFMFGCEIHGEIIMFNGENMWKWFNHHFWMLQNPPQAIHKPSMDPWWSMTTAQKECDLCQVLPMHHHVAQIRRALVPSRRLPRGRVRRIVQASEDQLHLGWWWGNRWGRAGTLRWVMEKWSQIVDR